LFRARSAFKKALIGEADTAGLSVGQILSLAARKAAAESGKYISAAGAFVLVLAISIGVLPNISQPVAPVAEPAQTQSATEPEVMVEEETEVTQPVEDEVVVEAAVPVEQVAATSPVVATPVAAAPEPIFDEFSLSSILQTNVAHAGYYTNSYASSDFLSAGFRASSIEIFGGTGISAFLDIDFANRSVYNVVFQMWVDGKRYYAVAENASAVTNSVVGGYEVVHRSSDFWVVDDRGNVFDQSPLANATAVVTLTLDANGNPVKAAMQVQKAS
jgi:hypothetical protein